MRRRALVYTRTAARPRGGGASTSQGHARSVFKRALEHDNLVVAEATAEEIGHFSLVEALELTALIARNRAVTLASLRDGCCATSRNIPRRRSRRRESSRPACVRLAVQARTRRWRRFEPWPRERL